MNTAKLPKKIKDSTLLLLLGEVVLFFWNLPRYLYQFLKGLRHFSRSYTGILRALEEQELWGESLKTARFEDPQVFTKEMHGWIKETIRLNNEHEKMFTQLFGILVAILALLVSVLALLSQAFLKNKLVK